jgi:hypothetical protein
MITRQMIEAARRAEFDYFQRNRPLGLGPFQPTSDAVIRAMLEAALSEAALSEAALADVPGTKPAGAGMIARVVKRRDVEAIAKQKATKQPASAIVYARKPRR